MLDSHPAMAVPDEAPWLVRLARERADLEPGGRLDADAFLHRLMQDRSYRRWGLTEAEVARALAADAPPTFSDAVRLVYGLYAKSKGKTRFADKTPWAVMHIPLLAALFPEAVFVHVIRDGRDVALSYLDAGFGPPSLELGALEWRRYVREGRRSGLVIGPGRYREVRYEELVSSPDTVVRDLCPFLGIDFDEAMLRYFERADEVVGSMPHPHARRNVFLPPTSGLRDWRTALTSGQAAVFTALAGPLLQELGYEAGARPAPRARLAATGAHIRWWLHRLRQRTTGASRTRQSSKE